MATHRRLFHTYNGHVGLWPREMSGGHGYIVERRNGAIDLERKGG